MNSPVGPTILLSFGGHSDRHVGSILQPTPLTYALLLGGQQDATAVPFRHTQKALQYPSMGTVPASFPIHGPEKKRTYYPTDRQDVMIHIRRCFFFF
jgi:hypothetical protein